MNWREVLRSSLQALQANRVRTLLTALGLVIGNASVILVVTISLTSRDYVLEQIRGIGSNLIIAYYEAGNRTGTQVEADFVKIADVAAVRNAFPGRISAATGVMTVYDQMVIQGKVRDVKIIGSDEQYAPVRNLVIVAGRFMQDDDVALRNRVAMLTEKLAVKLYGSQSNSIGQVVKIQGLQFTIIGTFREKTDSFGLSELSTETILAPITVLKYLTSEERIDPMYVQARDPKDVVPLTRQVQAILESRHRSGAKYYVDNLTGILAAAEQIALILTVVLILVSAITLVISGIGIMNIMLVTVTERTREIGIRLAVGATRREVLNQFLAEAVLISVGGGLLGILVGVAMPWSAGYFGGVDIPISPVSVGVAFTTSFLVGLVFGLLPANRASRMNPTGSTAVRMSQNLTEGLRFELQATCPVTGARAGLMHTAHGVIETPVFMPVGTQGTVKSLTPAQLMEDLDAKIILSNTYHLYLRPGHELIRDFGGLHEYIRWPRPILTDSGGFQVFSLSKIRKVTEEGVVFQSHLNGDKHLFTPESTVDVQRALGSDIMMVLDECLEYPPPPAAEVRRAMLRTVRWAGQAFRHYRQHETRQALFPIVQGAMSAALRVECAEKLLELNAPGYAIGGLSVGEPREESLAMTSVTTPLLPADRPRYVMGVGKPEELIEYVARGVDMMDCVMPSRNARNGCLFTSEGKVIVKNSRYREDRSPLDPACGCYTCRNFSKSYLRHLFLAGEILFSVLGTLHNLRHYLDIMKRIRQAILLGEFPELLRANRAATVVGTE